MFSARFLASIFHTSPLLPLAALSLSVALPHTARAQDLYVTYSGTTTANIARITPAGATSVFITSPGNLMGLASDASNNLYVDSNNGGAPSSFVTRINQSAVGTTIAFQVPNPTGLAFDTNGLLYAADSVGNTITKIDQTKPNFSAATTFVAAGNGLSGPQGLAFDSAGILYAANTVETTSARSHPEGR